MAINTDRVDDILISKKQLIDDLTTQHRIRYLIFPESEGSVSEQERRHREGNGFLKAILIIKELYK
jgi:hypothetical protein